MSDVTSPPQAAVTQHLFLNRYRSPSDVYDEVFSATDELRPHCRAFYTSLDELGADEFKRRWDQAQHLRHENSIAFSAYGDPQDRPRPWDLDPLPLILPESEWQVVSEAMEQRARLVNLVLADLFGPQTLIEQGLLPPEVLFRHPGFLRPYHGQVVPGGCYLHMYAADLARSPDGTWWVLGDRSEAPSGTGYTLENRIVISRMLPRMYQQMQVERLATYFMTLQETLQELATRNRDNPHVVILSQGPRSANFFEDAYLARYLGYTLVEGGDLAIRNDKVMLKTLAGLTPVDVILRRPNSGDCDPLELEAHSSQGVAGLLGAARRNNVLIANSLGSGLLESPIFMTFVPRLCQMLLGEKLKLPGVATWWCGDDRSLAYVLERLDSLTIKRAFRSRGSEQKHSELLSRMSREDLAATIRANPADFVAQEQVIRSTAPVFTEHLELDSSHIAIRAFSVRSRDGYYVMPGGLTRVSAATDSLELSILSGEQSKDTWILGDQPVSQASLLKPSGDVVVLKRGGAELPSRVADNLFWLGRLVERAEAGARLLRTTSAWLYGETEADNTAGLEVLLRALAEQGQIEPGFVVTGIRDQLPAIESALPVLALDESQEGSLRSTLNEMFRVASLVRDRISVDSWRIVHRIDQQFRPPTVLPLELSDLLALLNDMIVDLAALSGLVMESMTRGQAWRFLDLGRRLERTWKSIELIRCVFCETVDNVGPVLEAVLEVADSLMTYRSRYLANLQLVSVLDLLLTDETNPRSVAYQLMAISQHVDQLPRDRSQPIYSAEQRYAMTLLHTIRTVDVRVISELHHLDERNHLERLLTKLELQLPKLSDAISHRYLIHAGPPQQLSELRPD